MSSTRDDTTASVALFCPAEEAGIKSVLFFKCCVRSGVCFFSKKTAMRPCSGMGRVDGLDEKKNKRRRRYVLGAIVRLGYLLLSYTSTHPHASSRPACALFAPLSWGWWMGRCVLSLHAVAFAEPEHHNPSHAHE